MYEWLSGVINLIYGGVCIKSSNEDLRKRGMVTQQDMDMISHLTYDEAIKRINSKSPIDRTAAIRWLSICESYDDNFIKILLNRLCIEKCLYTKIEICDALEKGDITTARIMTNYLGKIGNNQYKDLPNKVSEKISYPLQRDIIARTLAKMSVSVFPALLEVFQTKDEAKISEVIDSIGYMIFYNQKLSNKQNFNIIMDIINLYSDNDIIFWKSVICLSAFHLEENILYLNDIILNSTIELIRQEAMRSKKLVSSRL